jgi:hypothetical protein
MQPEGLSKLRKSFTLSGLEPATFRLLVTLFAIRIFSYNFVFLGFADQACIRICDSPLRTVCLNRVIKFLKLLIGNM